MVKSSIELRNAIASNSPGATVKIRVNRDGSTRLYSIRLEEQPQKESVSLKGGEQEKASAALGLRAEELTAQLAQKLNVKPGVGKVVITSLDGSSSAYQAGLRAGDIILSVNKQAVTSLASYASLVKGVKRGDHVLLFVERSGNRIYFAFKV